MSNIQEHPIIKDLVTLSFGLKNYGENLEKDLFEQVKSTSLDIESFSKQAGFLAALQLYHRNYYLLGMKT